MLVENLSFWFLEVLEEEAVEEAEGHVVVAEAVMVQP